MIPIAHYLTVSALLFTTGAIGVLMRRNALIMLMSLELMFNDVGGHVVVFLSITVAAAEAAVGLAILLTIFRTRETVDVDNLHLLQR